MDNIIEVKNVTFEYEDGDEKHVVLNDFNKPFTSLIILSASTSSIWQLSISTMSCEFFLYTPATTWPRPTQPNTLCTL